MEPSNYPREDPPKPPPPPKQVPHWLSAVVIIGCVGGCYELMVPSGGSRASAMRTAALSDVKQLGLATLTYAESADGHLPIAGRWMDLTSVYIKDKSIFHAPGKQEQGVYGFAFRAKLSMVRTENIESPEKTALIFNSKNRTWNATGELDLIPDPPEFAGKNIICFADGHGKTVPQNGVAVR